MTSLGSFQMATVSGGRFQIDGGTMFGVVPKPLWNRRLPADDQNRIPQATNCLLIHTGKRTILIDTGYGSKLPEKQRRILCAEDGDPIVESLNNIGVSREQIDTVILTHLHFDHAGGATQLDEGGQLVPTFPNAEYVVQRREWVEATAGLPELRGVYPQENLLPLEESAQLRVVDGDVEIVSGIHSIVSGGHTLGHQVLAIESLGQPALYLADLCPTTHHLPRSWGMSYDVDMLQTRRKKPEVLGWITDNNGLALFDHDPKFAAARLQRDEKRDFAVAEAFETL